MIYRNSKLFVAIIFLILLITVSGCMPSDDFNRNLEPVVEPYLFNYFSQGYSTWQHEFGQWVTSGFETTDDEIETVLDYFRVTKEKRSLEKSLSSVPEQSSERDTLIAEIERLKEQKESLQGTVERTIERQVRDTLAEQGIFNPLEEYIRLSVTYPPMNFTLETMPRLLVISPRDRIRSMREITLESTITDAEIENIETDTDALGVSSLVVRLGGIGVTYPTMVSDNSSLRHTLDTVAEEWLHQYLTFRPLGFLYLLDVTGISRNYEIATINETVASIVSEEIGAMVYEKYYREHEDDTTVSTAEEPGFDFNNEMRVIRKAVDTYLAQGEIEKAESFMEEKRQYLADNGYYIRKLNQAYFAWHGTYADEPTSVSPIGQELRQLRTESASLKDFLHSVTSLTSHDELEGLAE